MSLQGWGWNLDEPGPTSSPWVTSDGHLKTRSNKREGTVVDSMIYAPVYHRLYAIIIKVNQGKST